jgi:hypothetical protein
VLAIRGAGPIFVELRPAVNERVYHIAVGRGSDRALEVDLRATDGLREEIASDTGVGQMNVRVR